MKIIATKIDGHLQFVVIHLMSLSSFPVCALFPRQVVESDKSRLRWPIWSSTGHQTSHQLKTQWEAFDGYSFAGPLWSTKETQP